MPCLPWASGSMEGRVSATRWLLTPQRTGISHKPLRSASHYCLHFPSPSFGPRATCAPAPRVPCSCAWAESSHRPAWLLWDDLGHWYWCWGSSNASSPWGSRGLALASHLSWGWLNPAEPLRTALLAPTCQVPSRVPGWGCWLCPGQGHPLGCQRGGTHGGTWRHTQSICAPSVLLTRPRACALCLFHMSCSPFPASHSLLLMLVPHSYSPCSAPWACSPFPTPCATPCSAALAGTHGSHGAGAAGLLGTTVCVCRGWRTV